jgi:predicted tellurium resistance membrane protein TerC
MPGYVIAAGTLAVIGVTLIAGGIRMHMKHCEEGYDWLAIIGVVLCFFAYAAFVFGAAR